jgi:hypothetical protein
MEVCFLTHNLLFLSKRSCQYAQFVFRHVVTHQQRRSSKSSDKPLYAVFVDFKGAYDAVDRQRMWEHLHATVGMPPSLLGAIQGLNEGDSCVVRDGNNTSPMIYPERGVHQGCPLSPLLFFLYINDVEDHIAQPHSDGSNAGVAITPDVNVNMYVPFVLYADDLTLFETTAFRMQTLIDRLSGYAKHKGLTVNVGTCVAMVCRTPQAQKNQAPLFSTTVKLSQALAVLSSWDCM